MRWDDPIIVIMDDATAVTATVAEAEQLCRLARFAPQPVIDRIVVAVDTHTRMSEAIAKSMVFVEREERHPKEQRQPTSPKARFRKGRY